MFIHLVWIDQTDSWSIDEFCQVADLQKENRDFREFLFAVEITIPAGN
jgi:hypothetical protein